MQAGLLLLFYCRNVPNCIHLMHSFIWRELGLIYSQRDVYCFIKNKKSVIKIKAIKKVGGK